MTSPAYARIYAVVRRIPAGAVATYGQVARIAGLAGHARQVGYAMHALPHGTRVPWQRVVNARGEISRRAHGSGEIEQRLLLQREGIRFDGRGRIDLARFGWRPRAAPGHARHTARTGAPSAPARAAHPRSRAATRIAGDSRP